MFIIDLLHYFQIQFQYFYIYSIKSRQKKIQIEQYPTLMKKTQTKSKIKPTTVHKPIKNDDKNIQMLIKTNAKCKKNNENTTSTLGSRNSMQSKIVALRNKNILTMYNNHVYDRQKQKENYGKMAQIKSRRSGNKRDANQGTKLNKKAFYINLKQNDKKLCQNDSGTFQQQLISYRQYCMVGENWVPMLTNTQRQRILNPRSSNRCSELVSQQQNQTFLLSKFSTFTETLHKFKHQLQQLQHNLQQLPTQQKIDCEKILKNAIQKFNNNKNNLYIPLAQNNKNQQNKRQQSLKQVPQVLNISNQINRNTYKSQQQQNKQDDQYEQNLLPQKQIQQNSYKEVQKQEISPVKKFQQQYGQHEQQINTNTNIKDIVIEQPFQNIIKIRELKQLGMLISFNNHPQTQPRQVDTTIINAYKYSKTLLQTIHQSSTLPEIIQNLKYAWGYSKKQKLCRIRQRKSLNSSNNVLSDNIFELVQDRLSQNCLFNFIHNKCMFDFINYQLNKLKPFYDSNGQTFPWSFSLVSPLTFFQIQQNTMSIAFQQISSKLVDTCSILCGLIVQDDGNEHNKKILENRRKQRQDMMIKKQLCINQVQKYNNNMVENQITMLFLAISDEIFGGLLEQVVGESLWMKYRE